MLPLRSAFMIVETECSHSLLSFTVETNSRKISSAPATAPSSKGWSTSLEFFPAHLLAEFQSKFLSTEVFPKHRNFAVK
ncbi:MAG: hypothetical protein A2W35_11330 [Chloroflexi bacterium RBG_16_57_11]|nr:MAG: hypothetical protein A2W35_11330 [Chloroflexi bacterium RBG_16_57_11]